MAVVRLHEMYDSGEDLIVLDTPPAKHAEDFFSASSRAAALFDERIIRWFLPNSDPDAGLLKRVFNPGAVVLKLLAAIGGDAFIAELSEFFEALNIISDKLRDRGERVDSILTDRATRYIVVAPRSAPRGRGGGLPRAPGGHAQAGRPLRAEPEPPRL